MNLEELRDKVSFWVGFNAGTPGQDFDGGAAQPWKRIDGAINMAIRDEYRKAVNECGVEAMWRTVEVTWPSGDLELPLPSGVDRGAVIAILDTTDIARGVPLTIGSRTSHATTIWKDASTLMWLTAGPGSDRTLSFEHIARPVELQHELDTPALFPDDFHDLLVWSAAIILKDLGDEVAPESWSRRQREMRLDLWKYLSAHSPRTSSPFDTATYHQGGE